MRELPGEAAFKRRLSDAIHKGVKTDGAVPQTISFCLLMASMVALEGLVLTDVLTRERALGILDSARDVAVKSYAALKTLAEGGKIEGTAEQWARALSAMPMAKQTRDVDEDDDF